MAEILAAADPKARLGAGYGCPFIYAGNKDAAGMVRDCLETAPRSRIGPNLRPRLEEENLRPARDAKSTSCSWASHGSLAGLTRS